MKARGYPVPHADLMQVATLIHADLSRDGYDVRIVPMQGPPPAGGGGNVVVEVRRAAGILHRSTGQGAVLKTWLTRTPQGFSAQIGTDRVGDAAAGAVEWLLATPSLVTEGYAAFQQGQVDERIFRVIDHFVTNISRVPIRRAAAPVPTVGPCTMCATPMPYGARFCPSCAYDTQSRAPSIGAACPGCQGPIALDAVFCPHCGKRASREANTCNKCRAHLDAGATFCSGCGARQQTPAAAEEEEKSEIPS